MKARRHVRSIVGWLGINQGTKISLSYVARYADLTSRFLRRLSTAGIGFTQHVDSVDRICESRWSGQIRCVKMLAKTT
jgi:hypothetical protein